MSWNCRWMYWEGAFCLYKFGFPCVHTFGLGSDYLAFIYRIFLRAYLRKDLQILTITMGNEIRRSILISWAQTAIFPCVHKFGYSCVHSNVKTRNGIEATWPDLKKKTAINCLLVLRALLNFTGGVWSWNSQTYDICFVSHGSYWYNYVGIITSNYVPNPFRFSSVKLL